MKPQNAIYFGKEGLTLTSANHLSNIARQYSLEKKAYLNSINFVNTDMRVISAGNEQTINLVVAHDSSEFEKILTSMQELGDLNSFIAWVGEAIKAKEDEEDRIGGMTFNDWAKRYVPEEFTRYQELKDATFPVFTEEDAVAEFNVRERMEYLSVEAKASVIGKYIHQNGSIYNANNKALKVANTPNTPLEIKDGIVTVESSYPSVDVDELNSFYLKLQAEHRELEKKLNSYKFRIKERVREVKAQQIEAHKKNTEEMEAIRQRLTPLFDAYIEEEKKELRDAKVIIPDSLKGIYEKLSK